MKHKILSCILVLCCLSSSLFARDVNTARRVANAFQNQQVHRTNAAPAVPMTLVAQGSQSDLSPAYFIFNGATNFVVVAGDDNLPAIIGYSDQGTFDPNNVPPNMQWWMDQLKAGSTQVETDLPENRPHYILNNTLPDSVAPLLGDIVWNQSAPFNDEAPVISGYTSPIGCIATAFAQVMDYHKYPSVGTGVALTYTTYTNKLVLSSDFNVPYDWDNMLDDYNGSSTQAEKSAVSHLMIDVAYACHMDFDKYSSGAFSTRARKSLVTYFNYDESIRGVYRSTLSFEEWENILKNELSEDRPFVISAASSTVGHAFVCDGYNKDNLFHINWGWGGTSNGYFLVSNLNPDSQGIGGSTSGYFNQIEATLNIKPADTVDDDSYYGLAVSRIRPANQTFDLSETQSITLSSVMNLMDRTYNGSIALLLYKASDHSFVKELGNTGTISLDFNYEFSNIAIDADFQGLEAGEYYFSSCMLPTASSDTIVMTAYYPGSQVPFTVTGSTATLTIPKFAVTGSDLRVSAPSDTFIYSKSPAIASFKLKAGAKLFNANYSLQLISPEGFKKPLETAVTMVRSNDSVSITTTFDVPYCNAGENCKILLCVDTLGRLDNLSYDANYLVVDSIPIEVKASPSEAPDFVLDREIYCEDIKKDVNGKRDTVYNTAVRVHVPLTNNGGYGSTKIACFVLKGLSTVTYETNSILLKEGESKELIIDLSGKITNPASYTFKVQKINEDYTAESFANSGFAGVAYFVCAPDYVPSAVDHTTISTLDYFNHTLYNTQQESIKIYNVSGLLMYEGADAQINLEAWTSGVYFVKTAHELLKVMR